MKNYVICLLVLMLFSVLRAKTALEFTMVSSHSDLGSYDFAEADSVLNLYYYTEVSLNMQVLRKTYHPLSETVDTVILWNYPISTFNGSRLFWHVIERKYGKIWVYIYRSGWVGVLTIHDSGETVFYQRDISGMALNSDNYGTPIAHHGEGQILMNAGDTIWVWNIFSGGLTTLFESTNGQEISGFYSFADEYRGFRVGDSIWDTNTLYYMIDNDLNVINTGITETIFYEPQIMDEGLYWVKFHKPLSYGSGTVLFNEGNVTFNAWNEYDIMLDCYGEYRPILKLDESRYLVDNRSLTSSYDEHRYAVRTHHGGHSFSNHTGFPCSHGIYNHIEATFFQGYLLMLNWLEYPNEYNFEAKAADLTAETWLNVDFPEPFVAWYIINNNEYLWLFSGGNMEVYHGQVTVSNEDATAPAINSIVIGPNPATPMASLKFKSQQPIVSTQMYNLRGQLIQQQEYVSQQQGDFILPNLSPGVYIIKLKDDRGKEYLRKAVIIP